MIEMFYFTKMQVSWIRTQPIFCYLKFRLNDQKWGCPNFNSNKPHQALRSEVRLIEKHYVLNTVSIWAEVR